MVGCEDKVLTLLNPRAQGWDVQLVYSLFPLDLAHQILKSSLLPPDQPDTLIWDLESIRLEVLTP